MPLLPQPSTVSPGRLVLLYTVGVLQHEIGTNLVAGTDLTGVSAFRTAAQAFRDIIKDQLTSISYVQGWKVTDLAGTTLYEEDFPEIATGVRVPLNEEVASQATTLTLTGKGRPPIGQAQGQTKVVFFPGTFDTLNWRDNRAATDAGAIDMGNLREWLVNEDLVGADHYGVKATWHDYMVIQVNSHYQKKYGL